ncbi:putative phosphatase regulatory subunit-domain-containing protein [Hysterangium stoloniferum]|nr:putative phosphatase regulatory subunit-domain-containing protein [Hysterangium stoloniferum]
MTTTQSRNHYRSSSYFLPDDERLGAAEFTPVPTLPHQRLASISTPTSSRARFRVREDDASPSADDIDSSEDARARDNNHRQQSNLERYNKLFGRVKDGEGSVKVPFPGTPVIITTPSESPSPPLQFQRPPFSATARWPSRPSLKSASSTSEIPTFRSLSSHPTPAPPSPPFPLQVPRPPLSTTAKRLSRPSLKSTSSAPEVPTLRSLSSHPTSSPPLPLQVPPPPSSATAKRPSRPSLKSTASTPEIPTLRSLSSHQVRFEDDEHIATVRIFNPAGRPRSVSGGCLEDTETETEGEWLALGAWKGSSPVIPSTPPKPPPLPTLTLLSSPIPADPPLTLSFPPNILLTSLSLKSHPNTVTLHGALLVLNRVYEKHVSVRFTLDNWATISEVQAGWKGEGILPSGWANKLTSASLPPPAYDTFTFQIQLSDRQRHDLTLRTLYFCARFSDPTGGEWWDNNNKKNYWVKFVERASPATRPRLTMGRSYSAESGYVEMIEKCAFCRLW